MVNSGLYTADNGFKSGYLQQQLLVRPNGCGWVHMENRKEPRATGLHRHKESYELFSGLRQGRNLVGVDIGQKSLALSISDPGHQLAYPLCVLPKDPDLMKSPYLMKVFVSKLRKTVGFPSYLTEIDLRLFLLFIVNYKVLGFVCVDGG
ncbi:hypothetical protein Tco_1546332 [Tanacetum coccineum]